MANLEEVEKHRDSFLLKNRKYGENALKCAKGVKDYNQLAERLKCHPTKASTLLNELIDYGLYFFGKDKTLKKTKEFIRVGMKPRSSITNIPEKNIRIRKVKKINVKFSKKEIENYILQNLKIIKNPFNKLLNKNLSNQDLKEAVSLLFLVLDSNLNFDRLDGLGLRFYESFAHYFSEDRTKKAEMINSFSSLIKNFEPYIKKLVLYKTKDIEKAKLSLNKELIQLVVKFESNLDNVNEDYWKNKDVTESCIRYVYPFRHIEAHEARDWDIFEMEKAIFYMFASIILINLENN
jgi:hypothetical protein